jgi:hypothetical protein
MIQQRAIDAAAIPFLTSGLLNRFAARSILALKAPSASSELRFPACLTAM